MAERVHWPVGTTATSGGVAAGELSLPTATGRAPAVLVFHEWWGLNDHIRSILGRLAEAGFAALAVDLYDGKTTRDAEEAGKMMGELDWKLALDRARGAVDFLAVHERTNGRVGVLGFCMGGALTLAAAAALPHLGAAVPFYGLPPSGAWEKVKAPVLAHFAARDQWAKPEGAQAIRSAIEAAGGSMELHVYDADHAFVNDTRPEVHHPENARLAWDRSIAFLTEHLRA
jgi:carboxymethylenebutenolidase